LTYDDYAIDLNFLILHQMLSNDTRAKLENIIRGIILEGEEDNCTAARNLLCASFRTSTTVKTDFEGQSIIKKEQAELLKSYCADKKWWIRDIPGETQFLARGGEAQIYLDTDNRSVIKINDAVYYATWLGECKLNCVKAFQLELLLRVS
jgi:hypothetical protein